jgi:hypothetical protein
MLYLDHWYLLSVVVEGITLAIGTWIAGIDTAMHPLTSSLTVQSAASPRPSALYIQSDGISKRHWLKVSLGGAVQLLAAIA